jgi:hypothetical protein
MKGKDKGKEDLRCTLAVGTARPRDTRSGPRVKVRVRVRVRVRLEK